MASKTSSETMIISNGDSSDSDKDIAIASNKFINFQDEPTQRYPSNNMCYKNKESLDSNDHSANGNAADNGDIDWYNLETQKYVKTNDKAVSKEEAKLKEKAQFKEPSVKGHVPAVVNIAMAETILIDDECEFHLDPPVLSKKTSDKCGNLDFASQCSDDEMRAAQNRVKEVLCSPALALSPQGLTLHERPSRPVYRSEPSSAVKVSKKQAVLFDKNCIISDDESEDDVPLPCITDQKKTPEISSADDATEAVPENGKDSEQIDRDVVPVPKIPVHQNRIKKSVVGNTAEDGSTETVGDNKGGRRGKSKRKEPMPSAVEKVVRSPAKKARKISAKDADQNRLPGPVECNLLLSSSPKTYSRKGQPGKSSEDFEVVEGKMLSKRGTDLMTSSNERPGLGKRSRRGKGNLAEDQESVMEDTDTLSRRQSKRKASDESSVRKENNEINVQPVPTVTRRSGRSRKATPSNDSDVSSCETPIPRVGVGSASSDQMNPAATPRRTLVKIPSIPNSPWTRVGSRRTVVSDEVKLTEKASESREPIKRGRRKVEPVRDVDADVHVDSPPVKTVRCSKADASAPKVGGSPVSEKQNKTGRSLTRYSLKKRLVVEPLADSVSDISHDAADVEECVQAASGSSSSCSKRAKGKNLSVGSDAPESVNAKSKRTTKASSQDRNGGDATNVRKGMDTVKQSASPKARSSRGRTPRRGVADSPVGQDVCRGKIVSPRKTATSNVNSGTGSLSFAGGDTVSKPKIMFTGLSNAKGEKIIKNLGGELVESVFDCTHLVTDKIRRTCKLLCIVARGQPVVSVDWLYSCQEAKRFLDSSPFLIKDASAEAQFHFGLMETLEKASKKRLLEGFKVHVTSSVKPDPDQMQPIIECAGGEFLQKMPRRITDDDSMTIVVSCVEDLKSCSAALKAGIPIVSSEFILTGVLQQEVDIEANRLDEKAKEVVSPVDKKVPIGKRGLQKSPKKSPEPLKSTVEPSPSPRRGGRKRGSGVPMQAEEEDDSGKKQKVPTRKKGRDNIRLESDDESKAVAMKPEENSRRRRSKQRN